MQIYNIEQDELITNGKVILKYKGYDLIIYSDGRIYVELEGYEDIFNDTDDNYKTDLADAIDWIEEDIKCRIENDS